MPESKLKVINTTKSDIQLPTDDAHSQIVTVGAPALRRSCIPVEDVQSVSSDCEKMVNLLRELKGAGLAASQIGLKERIIVVEVRKTELFPDRPESPLYVMIKERNY